MLDGGVLLEAEPIHQTVDAIAAEDAHEVILERDDELAHAGIALAAGTATQLVVDPARFVALGAENEETASLDDSLAQLDVGAATGHVGGDGDRPRLAGHLDDRRFFGVVLGVQHFVRYSAPLEHLRQALGLLHRDGADQDRLLALIATRRSSRRQP